jgi:hypothetical protein
MAQPGQVIPVLENVVKGIRIKADQAEFLQIIFAKRRAEHWDKATRKKYLNELLNLVRCLL